MKRISLVAAAVIPLVASAGGDKDLASWNYDEVKGDHRLSAMMDAEVTTREGTDAGTVQDVALDRDGSVAALIVATSGDVGSGGEQMEDVGFEGRQSMSDDPDSRDNTNYQATDDLSRTSADSGEGLARVEWDSVTYDAQGEALTVDENALQVAAATEQAERPMDEVAIAETRGDGSIEDQTRPIANRGEGMGADASEGAASMAGTGHVMASDLIGMDVNLAEDDSFGSVEDVLISDDGKVSAFVVDAWEGMDKQRIALPADIGAVDPEQGEINLDYAVNEVTALDEFRFEDEGM